MKLDLVEVHNGWKWMAIGFPNKRKCFKNLDTSLRRNIRIKYSTKSFISSP